MFSRGRKYSVEIKIIRDDLGIQIIKGFLENKSPNHKETPKRDYKRSRDAPLIQHQLDLSTLVSPANDDICRLVSGPEKTLTTPEHFSVTGEKWQRKRKKQSLKERRNATLLEQNNHCNGEVSPKIIEKSLMSIDDKAAPLKENMEIFANNGVNKLPDKQEIHSKPQFIKTHPAKLLDEVVADVQSANTVNAPGLLKDRPYVWIQEITESPSILEILKLFPYNSISENSCEISQDTELVYTNPTNLFSSNTSNSIGVETVQQIHANTVTHQLHMVEKNINENPIESAPSNINTARSVSSLTPANNEISKTPLSIPKLSISCGETYSSAVSVQQQQFAKGTSPLSSDIETGSKCKPLPDQQPTIGSSPSSTDIDAISKYKSLPNQQPPKEASPASTDIDAISKCKSLQQQQPPKGASPLSTDIEGLPEYQSVDQHQAVKVASPLSTDVEALSKFPSSNNTFVRNVTSITNSKMVAVNVENVSVNNFKSPNLSHPSPPLMSNSVVDKNTKHSWRKTRSYPRGKMTNETDTIPTKVVQKFKNVQKIQYATDLTQKLRSGGSQFALTELSTALSEKFTPDLIDSNAIMTKKSTPDLVETSSPLLVRKFKFHQSKRSNFAMRKRHPTRSDLLLNNQPNINITAEKDMNEDVGVSSEIPSEELEHEQRQSSCLATGSSVFSLTTPQSQQNPESTGADKKTNENFGSIKRNAVIIPPSEHISFTTCGDVMFSKTIVKTITKLAERSSNQVYIYLNKSPRSPHCKQNQLIFRVDSSTVPYKLVKTSSFFDEHIANDKTVLQISPIQSSKRKRLSRNSLKRQSSTYPVNLSSELSDSELILKDNQLLQFSPMKSPKRQGPLRNSPKRQSTTAPNLPNGESSGAEPMMVGKPLLQISLQKTPKKKRQPKNSMKRHSTTPPPNLPNEINESELIWGDQPLLQFSPKKSPKTHGLSKSSLKRQSTTSPPHLHSESSDPETKNKTLMLRFSSKNCTKIQELSRNSPKRLSTSPQVRNLESSGPDLTEIDTPLLQSSPKSSPTRELSRNSKKRKSTTPSNSSNDDDHSDPELTAKNKTLLLRFSPNKPPKRDQLSKNNLKGQLTSPPFVSNDESTDTEIQDEPLLLRFSSKSSPKRLKLSRNSQQKMQSTTLPHPSNDYHSDPELSIDKTMVQLSPTKSPRTSSSRSSLKRQSTTPPHLPNKEDGDLESLNVEPIKQDNLAMPCDIPEMPLNGGAVITPSSVISQWSCEDVIQWLTTNGLGRFTKDFAGLSGHGLVELVQNFNKGAEILQTYLCDVDFNFSEILKLYAALRVLHKQVSTSLAGKSSLKDHACSAQGKAAPVLQKNIPTPVYVSSNSHVPLAAENNQQISSNPISQWTCEDVCRWLTAHNLSRFTKDFSNVDGSCLVELATSIRSAPSYGHRALHRMGFTLSELLNLSANLSALSWQLTFE